MITCINPIITYIDNVVKYTIDHNVSVDDAVSIIGIQTIDTISLGENNPYCCSECGIYFLGSISQFINNMLCLTENSNNCCFNYETINRAKDNSWISDLMQIDHTLVCCNNFSSCSTSLFNLIQDEMYTDDHWYGVGTFKEGILEYGILGDDSFLCEFVQKLQSLPVDDKQYLKYFLDYFLSSGGFVVICEKKDENLEIKVGVGSYYCGR